MSNNFWSGASYGFGVMAMFATGYLVSKVYSKLSEKYTVSKIRSHNVIPIVNSDNGSLIQLTFSDNSSIQSSTQVDFIKYYNMLDKTKDIYIVMHTRGGALSSAEAITQCIINHQGPGKIICVIPYYAYSAGFCIALACHKIVMLRNAIVGPCDAQVGGLFKAHSIASINYAVENKLKKDEKVNEEWLASSYDANLCRDRQRRHVDKLVGIDRYDEETGNRIHEEFFSGKYNHDQVFGVDDLIKVGVKVEVVDKIPEFVNEFV